MPFRIRSWLLSSAAFAVLALGTAFAPHASAETLKEAMAKAYETNPVLLAQRAALRGTDEEVAQALSQWRPTVTVSGVAQEPLNKQKTPAGALIFRSGGQSWSSTVSASQTLFAGGRILAQRLLAGAQVRAGRAQLIATEQNVLLSVVSAYMDVVRDEEVVRLNETSVKLLRKQREAAQERFKVGEITRTDVAQAEARLAQTEAGLIAAQATLRSSQLEYERIVGNPPSNLEKRPALPAVPPTEDEVRRLAEANAPGYIAAQETVTIGEHSVHIAQGALLPTVSVSASYTHSESGPDFGSPSLLNNGTSVVGQVNIPIYQGGVEWANIRQAEENLNKSKMDKEQSRRTTLESASNAWESFRASRASRESNAQQLKAQETAFEGVQQEAEVGARTTLDVLDAQRELLNSQVALARSQRDEVVAAHNVLASVGALTAENLQLGVAVYDPVENYDDNAGKWWGPKGFGF
jgi:TolC family type I secretion outer membrane protein